MCCSFILSLLKGSVGLYCKIFLVVAAKYFPCGPNTHKQLKIQHEVNVVLFIYFIHDIYYVLRAFRL